MVKVMAEVDTGWALRDMLHGMVTMLVDVPEAARVTMRREENTVFLTVSVAAGDEGKVIGKGGRTARSLRTLVQHAAMRLGVVSDINIEEPERAGREG